jgi:hypothetical protein
MPGHQAAQCHIRVTTPGAVSLVEAQMTDGRRPEATAAYFNSAPVFASWMVNFS